MLLSVLFAFEVKYVNSDLLNLGKGVATTAIDHILLCCIFGPLKKMVTGAGGGFCQIKEKNAYQLLAASSLLDTVTCAHHLSIMNKIS